MFLSTFPAYFFLIQTSKHQKTMKNITNTKEGYYSDGRFCILPNQSIKVKENEISGHMEQAISSGWLKKTEATDEKETKR